MNHFEVFGLERRLGVDADALQRVFHALSRRWHPDVHAAAAPEDRARALQASARVNAAYRTLRDPIARIDYLVRLEEGREAREGAGGKPKAPPELLEEMFDIQEALAEARAAVGPGALDDATKKTLDAQRERLVTRLRDEEARLTGPLARAWDSAEPGTRPRVLEQLKEALATRAYLRTVIQDLGQALGDDTNEG